MEFRSHMPGAARRMRTRIARLMLTCVAALPFGAAMAAQTSTPVIRRASREHKQTGRAGPELFGVWYASSGVYESAAFSKDEPPMTPWGQAQFDAAKPSQGQRGVKLSETNDRVYKCAPPGVPYVYFPPFPMQILQTPREVIEIFEYDHTVRYIYTDGRKHPPDLTPSYNGHSIGHWEGDALVVDTIGLNGKNWLDRVGHPESSAMHVTERIRRVDENTLQVDFVFDDPKNYTKPWTAQVRFRLHPDWDILEHVCEDNLAFENFER
jgi:hypothetical protein